jgi:NADH-quinone oxidoreductase subunit M
MEAGPLQLLMDRHLLTLIVFQPLLTGVALLALETSAAIFLNVATRLSAGVWRIAGLGSSLLGLMLALALWRRFDPTASGLQLVEHSPWLGDWGIHYFIAVDGISLLLVILTSFLFPVVLIAAWNSVRDNMRYFILFMLMLQTALLGAFLSLNLFLFYVFWEALLVPVFFLIGIWGGSRRIYVTSKFFVFSMLGSVPMLAAILVLVFLHYQNFGVLTFDYVGIAGATGLLDTPIAFEGGPWWTRQTGLFAAFVFAFAVKVPLVPLHAWSPDAQVEAPTAGSVILAAVVLKLGAYGLLRYALPLFPEAAESLAPLLRGLAVIGIVYAGLVALAQSDLKRLVAYASISHMGFIILGLFALNPIGVEGALLQMVNHGISTAALFLLIGMLHERRGERTMEAFGGLAKIMPICATFFVITTFGSIGLPVLGGFVGEVLILMGSFERSPWLTALATSGILLTAVYMLQMVRRVFFGPLDDDANRKLADLSSREKLVTFALVIPMFWIGLQPMFFLNRLDRSTNELLETMVARGAELQARAPVPETRPAAEGGAQR